MSDNRAAARPADRVRVSRKNTAGGMSDNRAAARPADRARVSRKTQEAG
ncbi:hypothetical protein IU471_09155 [Nocardia elegans]|nr:hypothetical protein [Nocardia elegans]MBF6243746.1 hypothetical protein [Nocardia elegans]